MICQHCNVRPATTYLSEVVNGNKQEIYLCEVCAAEHQESFWGVDDFMQGFLGQGMHHTPKTLRHCSGCGLSEEAFLKSGKFGCARCPRTFEQKTQEVLKQVHGRTKHIGKVPGHGQEQIKRERELLALQQALSEAIKLEQYEEAAKLRDQMKALKGGDDGCGIEK